MAMRNLMLDDSRKQYAFRFGANLSRLIRESGMTQGEFAEACHISKHMVENYCQGRNEPTLGSIWIMASVLKCTYNELLNV